MDHQTEILIVGGGHAGAQVAGMLRQHGFVGSIAIATDEPHPPYERPPLSKDYLAGTRDFERMLLRTEAAWAEQTITLLPGRHVTRIDPARSHVESATGESIGYGRLVWAAGGHARRLTCPGADLPGVHTIRNRADADRLAGDLSGGGPVVVVGGGTIGLETASVLVTHGIQTTVVEAQGQLLARIAGPELSRFFEAAHRARGVDIRLNATVTRLLAGPDGRVAGVELGTGEHLPARLVVAGIGIAPAIGPLAEAGATVGNGIRIDEAGRTGLPGIYAAGDCTEQRNPYAGGAWVRIESVGNATDQGTAAARHICGLPHEPPAPPWFWSDQYDLRLQTIGLSAGHDRTVRRDTGAGFSIAYLREGRIIALDCVNAPRDYAAARRLVATAARIDPARLADPATDLRRLAKELV